ncbi:MAG: hypothetical protein KA886_11055 [Candidatus Cloacimonetes bacterium]|nr:hypothetical protein [Candidatus Cloacimonadota bacterium]
MKCPNCKEKLRVNKTINLDEAPMTIRYYNCPKCKKQFGSTEKLDKKYSDLQKPTRVDGDA